MAELALLFLLLLVLVILVILVVLLLVLLCRPPIASSSFLWPPPPTSLLLSVASSSSSSSSSLSKCPRPPPSPRHLWSLSSCSLSFFFFYCRFIFFQFCCPSFCLNFVFYLLFLPSFPSSCHLSRGGGATKRVSTAPFGRCCRTPFVSPPPPRN